MTGASMKVFRAVTVEILKSPTVHVPRHTIIMQAEHGNFPSNHRVVTWGDCLELAHAPRYAVDHGLSQIGILVCT